jgi:hypothetical protein
VTFPSRRAARSRCFSGPLPRWSRCFSRLLPRKGGEGRRQFEGEYAKGPPDSLSGGPFAPIEEPTGSNAPRARETGRELSGRAAPPGRGQTRGAALGATKGAPATVDVFTPARQRKLCEPCVTRRRRSTRRLGQTFPLPCDFPWPPSRENDAAAFSGKDPEKQRDPLGRGRRKTMTVRGIRRRLHTHRSSGPSAQ